MSNRSEESSIDSEPKPTGKTAEREQSAETRDAKGVSDKKSTSGVKLPTALRSLKHKNYRLFFGGQLISLIGTWMQSVAQSWLVYKLTDSEVMLGLVAFSGQIPVFLLAPIGGAFADRHRRHRILIVTQTVSMLLAFVLSALTLTGRVEVWHVFVLASLMGVTNALDMPTRQAFVADMVSRDDMGNAIALNSSIVTGARVIGPPVAGVLVATVGEGWCFFANAVSYIAVILGLLLMNIKAQKRIPVPGSTFIIEGFKYAWHTGPIRALLLLLGLVSLIGVPYVVLMPIFADRILGHGASGLGILMGASGVGALVGALSLAARQDTRGLVRWTAFSAASFGASLILFSLSRWFWVSVVLLLPVGFSMIVQMASSNTLIQAMVPDKLRGRVMAVYSMMFMGMAPFGALLAGAVAQRFGAPTTVAVGGAVCLVGAAVFRLHLPAIRQEARRVIITLNE